jgi:hypothetical protein
MNGFLAWTVSYIEHEIKHEKDSWHEWVSKKLNIKKAWP